MHKYLPHTPLDIKEMMDVIGIAHPNDLFDSLPKRLPLNPTYALPDALSDYQLLKHMKKLASQNTELTIFRGFGAYDHYTPSVVKSLTSRQEFLTAYTPYQPEVAQGTLHYIFEYQSMICELTGMDVTNASMYDGSTATAEAMFMAISYGAKKILMSRTVHPKIIEVCQTYAKYRHIEILLVDEKDGRTDLDDLSLKLSENAALIVQSPNVYGIVESFETASNMVHEKEGLFIMNVDAASLALFKTPRAYDADIACGELQSLGIPLSFGGAYIGFLAAKQALLRKMPGRICGVTTDLDGKRGFVLTLQAREQHIRRAKANSNICSNQSLMALSVVAYLSTLGKQGLIDVSKSALDNAHYLYQGLLKTKKFAPVFDGFFYKEFALKPLVSLDALNAYLLEHHILGPMSYQDLALFAVTEKRSKEEMDELIHLVEAF